jgi:hypothetical protein
MYDKTSYTEVASRRYRGTNTHSRRDIAPRAPFPDRRLSRIGDRFRSIMTSPFDTNRPRDEDRLVV